ncbi:MAG: HAD hydrolase-like protein [Desulfurococcaceae archaeon]
MPSRDDSARCTLVVDIDGTLIPILLDFEKLRAEIRRLLGVDHPLRPLGESLAKLQAEDGLKRKAWDLVERAELDSIGRLKVEDVQENIELVKHLASIGVKVVLVTMRSSASTVPLLSKLGLIDAVSYVITRDEYLSRREQLEWVLRSSQNARPVFIGDTHYDEEAAKDLHIPFIKVADYKEFSLAVSRALEECKAPV